MNNYKEVKNLIHNEYKITRDEVIQIIKDIVVSERMKNKADKLIEEEIDRIFNKSNKIDRQIKKMIEDVIDRIYGDNRNRYVHVLDKDKYLNKMVEDTVNKRVDKIVNELVNEELLYKLLGDKLNTYKK